jgi:hypothetical protein
VQVRGAFTSCVFLKNSICFAATYSKCFLVLGRHELVLHPTGTFDLMTSYHLFSLTHKDIDIMWQMATIAAQKSFESLFLDDGPSIIQSLHYLRLLPFTCCVSFIVGNLSSRVYKIVLPEDDNPPKKKTVSLLVKPSSSPSFAIKVSSCMEWFQKEYNALEAIQPDYYLGTLTSSSEVSSMSSLSTLSPSSDTQCSSSLSSSNSLSPISSSNPFTFVDQGIHDFVGPFSLLIERKRKIIGGKRKSLVSVEM